MQSSGQSQAGFLGGLRVLDLSQSAAGAQASQLLADFGADVIWVEPKEGGALADILAEIFAKRSKDEWQKDLALADVACVAITTTAMEAVLTGESGRMSGYVADVTHPVFDEHPRLTPLVRFSRSATQAKPGVLCGSATRTVLSELGYTDDQVLGLLSRKIVGAMGCDKEKPVSQL